MTSPRGGRGHKLGSPRIQGRKEMQLKKVDSVDLESPGQEQRKRAVGNGRHAGGGDGDVAERTAGHGFLHRRRGLVWSWATS